MGAEKRYINDETEPLTGRGAETSDPRASFDSSSTASISFTLVDHANSRLSSHPSTSRRTPRNFNDDGKYHDEERDIENDNHGRPTPVEKPVQRKTRIIFWILVLLGVGGWTVAFFGFLSYHKNDNGDSSADSVTSSPNNTEIQPGGNESGEKIPLSAVLDGSWSAAAHSMSWIPGQNDEDGLLLGRGHDQGEGYLRVEDVRNRQEGESGRDTIVLMKDSTFNANSKRIVPSQVWPSPDLKTVLIISDQEKNWRHSFTGLYWLFDVATQSAQPLDPQAPGERIQVASWSPNSDAVVFTRNNNMYIRDISSKAVKPVTTDGGADLFYGVPDWVYEEEVYSSNSVTWWTNDGKHVAFLRTNESMVPEFPVQYFLSRPSGDTPNEGEEQYPDIRQIKYPKAGSPNPVVNVQYYDIEKGETFSVDVTDEFPDDDRVIVEVIPASNGTVLVRETNRESDNVKMILVDLLTRKGKVVRSEDINAIDGGWVEPSQSTKYIPADPDAGRLHDGYIDTVIHEGYDHLAYFTPLENSDPVMLTSGKWEVVDAPSAVDLKRGLVYFVATKEDPAERHVYSVNLNGTDLQPIVPEKESAYYGVSFSTGAGYMLLQYQGPEIPWQKLINTPANKDVFEVIIEENDHLKTRVKNFALPSLNYGTIDIDGYSLPFVERRPPNFDPKKKYPVLFHLYGGPGSQTVSKKFKIDFQTYVASSLEYLIVTVDGRGTGFIGREARCIVRDTLGVYEAHDQIKAAQLWGKKPYVDKTRMAIWGWSYGGFMALKTLEQDAGETFQYGMAVAPVTDWRYYGEQHFSILSGHYALPI